MVKIPYYESSYFVFSNLSPLSVQYKGILYPTSEHAYHSAKFDQPEIKEEIRKARSPLEVVELARRYEAKRKKNWEKIKLDIMYEILKEKIGQHKEMYDALITTGNEEIVEDNPNNNFWGNGKDKKGENQMGKTLMKLRQELKQK